MDLEYVAIDCMNRVHDMGLLSVNEQVYFMYDTTRLMMFYEDVYCPSLGGSLLLLA